MGQNRPTKQACRRARGTICHAMILLRLLAIILLPGRFLAISIRRLTITGLPIRLAIRRLSIGRLLTIRLSTVSRPTIGGPTTSSSRMHPRSLAGLLVHIVITACAVIPARDPGVRKVLTARWRRWRGSVFGVGRVAVVLRRLLLLLGMASTAQFGLDYFSDDFADKVHFGCGLDCWFIGRILKNKRNGEREFRD